MFGSDRSVGAFGASRAPPPTRGMPFHAVGAHSVRPVCEANNRPQGDPAGCGISSGCVRRTTSSVTAAPCHLPLKGKALDLPPANCVRTERRSDVGILRDFSSSLPTGERGRQGAVPTEEHRWETLCGLRASTGRPYVFHVFKWQFENTSPIPYSLFTIPYSLFPAPRRGHLAL